MVYSGINVEISIGCSGCVDRHASVFILSFSLLGCVPVAYVYTDIRRACNVQHCSVGSELSLWADAV
jgi:hypothetical protein